jgi:hypothetical protein
MNPNYDEFMWIDKIVVEDGTALGIGRDQFGDPKIEVLTHPAFSYYFWLGREAPYAPCRASRKG